MRRTPILLACFIAAPSHGCGKQCDCPEEQSVLGFTLLDGQFEAGGYEIVVDVDAETRATCSSDFGDGTGSAVVTCDDPTVEVTQKASTVTVTLPEFEEHTEVSVEVADDQGLVWTGSAIVEKRFYDSLENCLCLFGDGTGDLTLSEGG